MQSSVSFRSTPSASLEESRNYLQAALKVEWVQANRAAIEEVLSGEISTHGAPGAWFKPLDAQSQGKSNTFVAHINFDGHPVSVTKERLQDWLETLSV